MRSKPLPWVDAATAPEGAVTQAISGWDPAAPRRLTLWRVENGRRAILARTRSDADGSFRFPEVAAGSRELAVAADDEEPGEGDVKVALAALPTEPPTGQIYGEADGAVRVRLWPSASAASVIVSAGGRELARRSVPSAGVSPGHALDLIVAPRATESALWIAEERADGARSAWRRLAPLQAVNEVQPSDSIP